MLYLYGVCHQYLGLCFTLYTWTCSLIFKQDMRFHVTLRFSADASVILQVSEWVDGRMDDVGMEGWMGK